MEARKIEKLACLADRSDKAQMAYAELKQHYDFVELGRASKKKGKNAPQPDAIIVLGGDGFMLEMMHQHFPRNLPFYGMNCGTVGFLLNQFRLDNLLDRVNHARDSKLHPLRMYARCRNGKSHELMAINEVSLFRQTRQAAKIRVTVDHVVRIDEMVGDGILASTPAGSTAYNFSAGGPIVPLDSNLLALTPLNPFRPRRWRGALLPNDSSIYFEVLEPDKRPVGAVADFTEIRDIASVSIGANTNRTIRLMFDPEHHLEERIIHEQFM